MCMLRGGIRTGYARAMQALAVVLTVALGWRWCFSREQFAGRRRVQVGIDRLARDTVPREELSEALASREALLTGLDDPALVLRRRQAACCAAGRAARRQVPELIADAPGSQLAEPVASCLTAGDARTAEVTVYHPERRRFQVTLQPYTTPAGQACVAVLADTSAQDDFRDAAAAFLGRRLARAAHPAGAHPRLVDTSPCRWTRTSASR